MERRVLRLTIGFLGGAVACAAVIGLAAVTGAGADLPRFLHWAAALFLIAGVVAGRGSRRAALASGAGVVLGGCAPVIALAIAGIAFISLVWSGSVIAMVVITTATGALTHRATRPQAFAILAVSALVFVATTHVAVPRLLRHAAIERSSRPIPPLAIVTADGREITRARWRGKVIVLAFWATWCKPCRAELPELQALHARYRDDPRIELLSVNAGTGGDTLAGARAFATTHGWDLPLAFTENGAAMATLGISNLPALVVVDRTGRLRVTHRGYDRSEQLAASIATEVDRLLAEP